MTKSLSSRPPEPAASRNYETRDASATVVATLVGAIFLLCAGAFVGQRYLLNHYERTASEADRTGRRIPHEEQEPPAPRLQYAPARDFVDYIEQQNKHLESYGWVDRQQRLVRIPIDRAIDLALERGLPVPKSDPAPTSGDTPANAASSPTRSETQPAGQSASPAEAQ